MENRFETVIGLEVHAELNTRTKIFCGCKNEFGAPPNTNCCPVCTGMPGTLPRLNAAVVDSAVLMGLACSCRINEVCSMDRKNYFYPDLPKAYQISQFDVPVCEEGYVDVLPDERGASKRVGITRIHMEEDAGKLLHGGETGTRIDFNRCGVPLIEIVTEPDLRSSSEVKAFLDTVRLTLLCLGISDCRMQEGSLRCDVNVSVRPAGSAALGERVEMKNVNSFSAAVRAVEYESARQIRILSAGGTVRRETRRWDDGKGESSLLRDKEETQDYRFFPEPDLGPVVIARERVEALRGTLPELPAARCARFMRQYGLSHSDALLLTEHRGRGDLFEKTAALGAGARAAANWLNGDVARLLGDREPQDAGLTAKELAFVLDAIDSGRISHTAGKTVVEEILTTGKSAEAVIAEKGLAQISDREALARTAKEVLENNQKAVGDYLGGKGNVLGYLVGQCMRASRGSGNPEIFREILRDALEEKRPENQ